MNQKNKSQSSSSNTLLRIIAILYLLSFTIGLISFIIGFPFIFDAILLNPIAWICYAIVSIPTIIFIVIIHNYDPNDSEDFSINGFIMMVIQILIGIIYAILTIIFIIQPTGNSVLDFLILFPMFLFGIVVAIIAIIIAYAVIIDAFE